MEEIFRQATAADVPQMMDLWRLCFREDDEPFIQRFFAETPVECAIIYCKGDVLSMAFLLPAEVCLAGESYPVRYLYAGCTHPDCRGQGIYTRLLQYATAFVTQQGGCAIYLHPASASLESYYEKCGYRPGIGGWRTEQLSRGVPVLPQKAVSAGEYLTLRNALLPPGIPVWRLAPPADAFFMKEMTEEGWQTFADANGCGLLSPDGTQVYDAIGTVPALPSFGINPAGLWQETAWWIPTDIGDNLMLLMNDSQAYTAFLGDI